MAKTLKKGDRVKLKGRIPEGVIKTMGVDNTWVVVDWDEGKEGPKYVDLYEVELVNHG